MNEKDAAIYLALGITANEVVRLRWPDIDDERADHLLWEHTPYPMRSGLLDIVEAVAGLDEVCEHQIDPWHQHSLDVVDISDPVLYVSR